LLQPIINTRIEQKPKGRNKTNGYQPQDKGGGNRVCAGSHDNHDPDHDRDPDHDHDRDRDHDHDHDPDHDRDPDRDHDRDRDPDHDPDHDRDPDHDPDRSKAIRFIAAFISASG
jgi:hypothetical protein